MQPIALFRPGQEMGAFNRLNVNRIGRLIVKSFQSAFYYSGSGLLQYRDGNLTKKTCFTWS